MPNLIGGIVLGYIWLLIINGILINSGVDITFSARFGFWGLVVVTNWQMVGYMMIIYIAGILAIPPELMEAARIDGARSSGVGWCCAPYWGCCRMAPPRRGAIRALESSAGPQPKTARREKRRAP